MTEYNTEQLRVTSSWFLTKKECHHNSILHVSEQRYSHGLSQSDGAFLSAQCTFVRTTASPSQWHKWYDL